MDAENVSVWTTWENRVGKLYRGMGGEMNDVSQHKQTWGKIKDVWLTIVIG